MSELELSAGTIEYLDTGGDGPAVVLLHGLLMDETLWAATIAELPDTFRCIVPTLPLGAHRRPMAPGADLSLPGIARLVQELVDKLDLHDVTLVGNDTGGALVQLLITDSTEWKARVGRIGLVSCEAFDNFPPGLTGTTIGLLGKLPAPVFGLFMQQLRLRAMRRLPISFGWLTKRGDAVTAGWLRPILTSAPIRRDAVRMLRAALTDKQLLVEAVDGLPGFDRPALIVWAVDDRVMPPEHGQRLATLFPHGRLVEVEDSYTLIPLDQPSRLAAIIAAFSLEAPESAAG